MSAGKSKVVASRPPSAGSIEGASRGRALAAKKAASAGAAASAPPAETPSMTVPAVATATVSAVSATPTTPVKILARPSSAPQPGTPAKTPDGPLPRSLAELLGGVEAMKKAGVSQATIVEWLYDVCAYYNIRVRHDLPELAASQGQAGPARAANPEDASRVVLSAMKSGPRVKEVPLQYECNGLVLDLRTWRVLAMPPGAFNLRPVTKTVNEFLAQDLYDVIRVDDGTLVTLYRWQHPLDGPVWAMASSNGYDVSSLRWVGRLSYAEVFHDLATRLYPAFVAASGLTLKRIDKDIRLEFTALDPAHCYTIGFRHHNFHPLLADPERMWLIQTTDLATLAPASAEAVDALVGLAGLPRQVVSTSAVKAVAGTPLKFEQLRTMGASSIAEAAAFIAHAMSAGAPDLADAGDAADAKTSTGPRLNYGVILRSRDPARTGLHSDLLVESPLLTYIRKRVYERAPANVRDKLTEETRLEYNAMRSFLTQSERREFLALYPHWKARFLRYEEFVNNLVTQVTHNLRQQAMGPASVLPTARTSTGRVAAALFQLVRAHEKLSAFHKDTERIVRDYVMNPEYAFMYVGAILADDARAHT